MNEFELNYYDRSGIPISAEEWGRLHVDRAYMIVEQTIVMDAVDPGVGFDVSTVWLGIDHSFTRTGLPIIFETMVFPMGGAQNERNDLENSEGWNASELACSRYCFENEAREQHALFVIEYSLKLVDPILMDRPAIDQKGS